MRWWPPRLGHNDITTQHKDPHPTDPPYRVSSKPSLVTYPSIESFCHNNLGNLLSEALTTSPSHILNLNASTRNSPFVKPLCLSVKIIFMIKSVGRCPLPPLITTLHYTLTKTTYHCHSTLTHPIIWLIETYLVRLSWLINPAQLVNPHFVNYTNQILFNTSIREALKKRYIKSMMRKQIYILRASIQPQSKKATRFNIQMRDLIRWTLISLVLRLHVRNMELLFLHNPDSTGIWKTAAFVPLSTHCLVPLLWPYLSSSSLQDL